MVGFWGYLDEMTNGFPDSFIENIFNLTEQQAEKIKVT